MTTIRAALAQAVGTLEAISESPRLDAELLLAQAIDMPRSFLFAHADDDLDEAAIARFQTAVGRRACGEPLAYLTGDKEFWSLPLMVSPATLVPRPETELLVEQVLSLLPRRASARIADLGTGSGAIALAIARERPLTAVVATDASHDALAVAAENARQLGIANVEFVHGDWCAPLQGQRFDLVVSNPPYIEDDDPVLSALAFEPRAALAAGADGLDAIRAIVAQTPTILRAGATLLIEHGADQGAAVTSLLDAAGFRDTRTLPDLAGRARVSRGSLPGATIDRELSSVNRP